MVCVSRGRLGNLQVTFAVHQPTPTLTVSLCAVSFHRMSVVTSSTPAAGSPRQRFSRLQHGSYSTTAHVNGFGVACEEKANAAVRCDRTFVHGCAECWHAAARGLTLL
jgi:hypothetical protein